VLTTGGIYGTITEAEDDDIVVEIAPAVTVHMTRRGIAAVLPPEEEHEDGDEDEAEDADEGAVTDGEEAVRSTAGDAPSGDGHR
jgi:Preprotein translocase subunit